MKLFQIVYECGCGNMVKEKIDPTADSYVISTRVCNKCGNRSFGYAMNHRVEFFEGTITPSKSKK